MKRKIAFGILAGVLLGIFTVRSTGCAASGAEKDLTEAKQQQAQVEAEIVTAEKRAEAFEAAVGEAWDMGTGDRGIRESVAARLGESDPLAVFLGSLIDMGVRGQELLARARGAINREAEAGAERLAAAQANVADAEAAYDAAVESDMQLIQIGGQVGNIWLPGVAAAVAGTIATGYGTWRLGKKNGKVEVSKIMRDGVRNLREEVPGVNEALEKGKAGEFFRVVMDNDQVIERAVTGGDKHRPRKLPEYDPYVTNPVADAQVAALMRAGKVIRPMNPAAAGMNRPMGVVSDPTMG